jgi:hypothetical protein
MKMKKCSSTQSAVLPEVEEVEIKMRTGKISIEHMAVAVAALQQIDAPDTNTFRRKVSCLLHCKDGIFRALQHEVNGEPDDVPGMDDFLPCLLYCIAMAHLDDPSATSAFLSQLCPPQAQALEAGFFITTLEAAIYHILVLDDGNEEEEEAQEEEEEEEEEEAALKQEEHKKGSKKRDGASTHGSAGAAKGTSLSAKDEAIARIKRLSRFRPAPLSPVDHTHSRGHQDQEDGVSGDRSPHSAHTPVTSVVDGLGDNSGLGFAPANERLTYSLPSRTRRLGTASRNRKQSAGSAATTMAAAGRAALLKKRFAAESNADRQSFKLDADARYQRSGHHGARRNAAPENMALRDSDEETQPRI